MVSFSRLNIIMSMNIIVDAVVVGGRGVDDGVVIIAVVYILIYLW